MKDKFFQIVVLALLSFGAYNIVSFNQAKQANAFCGFDIAPVIAQEITSAIDQMMNMVQSAKDFLQKYVDINQEQMDETQEQLIGLASEQRMADIELMRAKGAQKNAAKGAERALDYQESQYEDILEHPAPSELVCANTAIGNEAIAADNNAEVARAISMENRRRADSNYSGTRRSGGGAAFDAALLEQVRETCVSDEHGGNVSGFCKKDLDEELEEDYPEPDEYLTCDGCTIDPNRRDEFDTANELANPTLENGPFNDSIETDPATQEAYLESLKERSKKVLDDAIQAEESALKEPMESCEVSYALVKLISQRYYNHPYAFNPENVCPSLGAIKRAQLMYLSDPVARMEYTIDMKGNSS